MICVRDASSVAPLSRINSDLKCFASEYIATEFSRYSCVRATLARCCAIEPCAPKSGCGDSVALDMLTFLACLYISCEKKYKMSWR